MLKFGSDNECKEGNYEKERANNKDRRGTRQ